MAGRSCSAFGRTMTTTVQRVAATKAQLSFTVDVNIFVAATESCLCLHAVYFLVCSTSFNELSVARALCVPPQRTADGGSR